MSLTEEIFHRSAFTMESRPDTSRFRREHLGISDQAGMTPSDETRGAQRRASSNCKKPKATRPQRREAAETLVPKKEKICGLDRDRTDDILVDTMYQDGFLVHAAMETFWSRLPAARRIWCANTTFCSLVGRSGAKYS